MMLPTFAALLRLSVIGAGGILAAAVADGYAALLVVIVLGYVAYAATNCLNYIRPVPPLDGS